jgi:hypothetical protein
MSNSKLIDIITRTDIDLRIQQSRVHDDADAHREIEVARALLDKLKQGVLRGHDSILLGVSWPLSTIGLVLPAISALEMNGISVLYLSDENSSAEISEVEFAKTES